jgi:single-strand selective monofunctional uracil DNA glycosylase
VPCEFDDLALQLAQLHFGPPVTHVYNPMIYARQGLQCYLARYGQAPREVVLVGMNPGPWGMAQTGVPFGDVGLVRDWLGIHADIAPPPQMHPRRPVQGFACPRGEASGRRLWGWARERFGTPERFFARFFVANYCPLMFLEADGRNRTPDKLPGRERAPLLDLCDAALRDTVRRLRADIVVGIGRFAAERCASALGAMAVRVGRMPHPSPASPRANRGWARQAESALAELGIALPP